MKFTQPYTLAQLAEQVGGTFNQDGSQLLHGVASLKEATTGDISFLNQAKYLPQLADTQATVVMLTEQHAAQCTQSTLIVKDAHVAFAKLMQLCVVQPAARQGVHTQATVASTAQIDETAFIDAQAVIGEHVQIGAHAVIGAGSVIGAHSQIGAHTRIMANVTLYEQVHIGAHCLLHSGVVIGADGFGFANDNGQWLKIPQLAGVEIADHVEIGANTAVDAGVLSPTRLGLGVKIDNLVQVGHNVQIGDHTIIAGCVAIAGSAVIGKHCAIGGAACLNGHITIADGVQITATAGVLDSIDKPGVYSAGIPAVDNALWRKNTVSYFRLPDVIKRLRALEKAQSD